MTMASFMKFQENFINKNAKLKGEEIEIKRFVTDFGLEVEIRKPKDSIKIKCKTAILLTHPWSVLGGDMDNNVPETLCHLLMLVIMQYVSIFVSWKIKRSMHMSCL